MKQKKKLRGKLSIHPKGFGFVTPECGHEDVFIPSSKIESALDGDVVEVGSLSKSAKGWEGAVEKVLKQARKSIVGSVYDFTSKDEGIIFAPSAGEERVLILK